MIEFLLDVKDILLMKTPEVFLYIFLCFALGLGIRIYRGK